MPGYSITLTTNRDFLLAEIDLFRQWFANNTDSCLLVQERGTHGQLHLHAGTQQTQLQTGQVTRLLTRLYEQHDIPLTKGVSIKVKKTCEMVGWFHYLLKEVTDDQPPILVHGWQLTWIQEQCRDNLKKMPHRMLKGTDYVLNMVIAPNAMIRFADSLGMNLSTKEGFKEVCCRMAEEGYQFQNIKFKILYTELMARYGDYRPMKSLIDNELAFLD